MIHNAGCVLPGLLLFLAVALGPFFLAAGDSVRPPALVLPSADKGGLCIEDRAVMAASHMVLLDSWREAAVRENAREHRASDGKIWIISLERTCFSCHTRKADFCDACHTAQMVKPYCWECHTEASG
ncbi:MAG: sulfate reduction electron transfer complex DsrMKJOP subunit DsrJ [Deltaproteobacteria bacterium]|nr:sulfate reduction electron transfer complex DsrMKJOP subunit DsrJ [Deltaproteobacteria bacterium]